MYPKSNFTEIALNFRKFGCNLLKTQTIRKCQLLLNSMVFLKTVKLQVNDCMILLIAYFITTGKKTLKNKIINVIVDSIVVIHFKQ